ncbi:MAG: tRNA (adenosine(37)-N6)-threonylcarbamoyltransferase complex dimerization subunit type 1 TsaB [Acidobacteriota bacterium]
MVILALDTTTRSGSAAVVRDDAVAAAFAGDGDRTHGERLPGELAAALDAAGLGLAEVDLLAVAIGPGAFTGLRIGLAAIQGLALALDKPVVGISALEALAVAAADARGGVRGPLGAWMDAARGEIFAALFDVAGGAAVERRPASVGAPEAVLEAWASALPPGACFAGDGALRYRQLIEAAGHTVLASVPLLAPVIARLAARQATAGFAGPPHALRPLYVRRPDAERSRPATATES